LHADRVTAPHPDARRIAQSGHGRDRRFESGPIGVPRTSRRVTGNRPMMTGITPKDVTEVIWIGALTPHTLMDVGG
jgi:hypothetical protein